MIGTVIITEHIMQFIGHKYNPLETFEAFEQSNEADTNIIETLVRQSSRYAFAAEQDESPLVSVLHANYAAGYLWALKDVVNEKDINAYLGANKLKQLSAYVTQVQDKATKEATRVCPSFIGASGNPLVASLAGNI